LVVSSLTKVVVKVVEDGSCGSLSAPMSSVKAVMGHILDTRIGKEILTEE